MYFDLFLAFATIAILLSPLFIDFWKYRELRMPHKERDHVSIFRMSS